MKAESPFLLCSWVNDITMGQSQYGPINCLDCLPPQKFGMLTNEAQKRRRELAVHKQAPDRRELWQSKQTSKTMKPKSKGYLTMGSERFMTASALQPAASHDSSRPSG